MISQKGRQAAADALAWYIGEDSSTSLRQAIIAGKDDGHYLVQAFAAHRQAAMIQGARLMQEAAIDICAGLQRNSTFGERWGCEQCVDAIEALDPTTIAGGE